MNSTAAFFKRERKKYPQKKKLLSNLCQIGIDNGEII